MTVLASVNGEVDRQGESSLDRPPQDDSVAKEATDMLSSSSSSHSSSLLSISFLSFPVRRSTGEERRTCGWDEAEETPEHETEEEEERADREAAPLKTSSPGRLPPHTKYGFARGGLVGLEVFLL